MTTIDIEAARALLARVGAASGPDHNLDLDIRWHLVCRSGKFSKAFRETPEGREVDVTYGLFEPADWRPWCEMSPGTALGSLDAAVALTSHVLPGTNVELEFTICAEGKFVGGTRMWLQEFGDDSLHAYGDSGSRIWHPAQSIVACTIRALIARAEAEKDPS